MKQSWLESLEIRVDRAERYPCVRLAGEGNRAGAARLAGALRQLIDDGSKRIIIDTRDVRFLDQACYSAVEQILADLEDESGLLVLVDQSLPVERTLKLLNLERLVSVVPSKSQATAYLDWHE